MILSKRIPKEFYKLFRTQNMEYYMTFLVAIYEENNEAYTSLGLTAGEGLAIIRETAARMKMKWREEPDEEAAEDGEEPEPSRLPGTRLSEGRFSEEKLPGTRLSEERLSEEERLSGVSPSAVLRKLIRWGWLKSDYDEKLNAYIISFPEYSQLYVELFQKLQCEEDSRERESILSIYSSLFTYHSDGDKNNDILKSALRTSKNLGQLLSNMQDGMRAYFDELSGRKNFIGIQEVLVDEINNSDSKKYAILTTTDSFYRYKEAVKELICQILNENEMQKNKLRQEQSGYERDSVPFLRGERAIAGLEEAEELVYRVEREFDLIERKYNKLIEQKSIFAQRALARIRYIFQEGAEEENNVVKLLWLLEQSPEEERILEELRDKIKLTSQFQRFSDQSLYSRRENSESAFAPIAAEPEDGAEKAEITDFVPRPLYTKQQLQEFRQKHTKDGVFATTKDTVRSVEDLEKLMFLWQETTERQGNGEGVYLGEEFVGDGGFAFSELIISKGEKSDVSIHGGVVPDGGSQYQKNDSGAVSADLYSAGEIRPGDDERKG